MEKVLTEIKKRDNEWLEDLMYDLWENNFNDVPRKNLVVIKFGKHSKRQLGCIQMASSRTTGIKDQLQNIDKNDIKNISLITITRYFKDPRIPKEIVLGTIAHEMCHYAHGFSSPLQKIYDHPHKGGVIRKELSKRGLGELYKYCNKWLKLNWSKFVRLYDREVK